MKTTGDGTIGKQVILENEHVRVWLVDLEPGELQSRHTHHLPFVVVAISGGKAMMRFDDGRPDAYYEDTPGDTIWRMPGCPHELESLSDRQYQSVVIELKGVDPNPKT